MAARAVGAANPTVAEIQSGADAGLAIGLSPGETTIYVEYSDNGTPVPCEGLSSCEARLRVRDSQERYEEAGRRAWSCDPTQDPCPTPR